MKHAEVVVIGAGPAGLMATKSLLDAGVQVTLIDRSGFIGGQLTKQTHKFFGSKAQFASMRGFEIASELENKIKGHPNLDLMLNTDVIALYPNNVILCFNQEKVIELQSKKIILATGASEKYLAFENNDVPQIMGAGAIQTLMNLYGVLPAQEVVMIGSGNIGLIVSYQLLQAGVKVKAIVDASSVIGGYKVHASKLRRLGVPFYLNTTINKAIYEDELKGVELVNLITQEKTVLDCDTCCIAVGLSPSVQLAAMLEAEIKTIPELGGDVVIVDENFKSSIDDLYVCGDACGIEEASSAMMEGALCGLAVAKSLNKEISNELEYSYKQHLNELRDGPFGQKIRRGFDKMKEGYDAL